MIDTSERIRPLEMIEKRKSMTIYGDLRKNCKVRRQNRPEELL